MEAQHSSCYFSGGGLFLSPAPRVLVARVWLWSWAIGFETLRSWLFGRVGAMEGGESCLVDRQHTTQPVAQQASTIQPVAQQAGTIQPGTQRGKVSSRNPLASILSEIPDANAKLARPPYPGPSLWGVLALHHWFDTCQEWRSSQDSHGVKERSLLMSLAQGQGLPPAQQDP